LMKLWDVALNHGLKGMLVLPMSQYQFLSCCAKLLYITDCALCDHLLNTLIYICRYPDVDVTSHFGDMACCQRCKLRYHAVCMKIPEDVFKKPSRKWLCSKCAL